MGSRNPDRTPRLRSFNTTPPGYVRLAICKGCGHYAALPIAQLLARYGELFPVEMALFHVKCTGCGECKVEARLARLCDPGCPKQR